IIIKDVFGSLVTSPHPESPVRIIKAENGKEAIEKYNSESPELVFLDIQMPIKNGYQVAQQIRKTQSKTIRPCIIALTAAEVKGEREICMQAGMDEYLTKPVVHDTIKRILSHYLSQLHQNKFQSPKVIDHIEKNNKAISNHDSKDMEHFNSELLKHVFQDDQQMFTHIVNIGKKSLTEERQKLVNGFTAKEISSVKKSAHKIKGMALNLRFELLHHYAECLEDAADEKESVASVKDLYQKVLEEIKLLEKMI
ncbi:MAG: response regulator, partial [Thermotogota bacterium]